MSMIISRRVLASSSRITFASRQYPIRSVSTLLGCDMRRREDLQCSSFPTPIRIVSEAGVRWSSSSTTPKEDTLRQRMTDRAQQQARRGAKAARKGAKAAKRGAVTAGGMVKQYGPVFAGTYLGIYAITLGSLFVGVDSGLLDPATLMSSTEETASTVKLVVEFLNDHGLPFAKAVEKNPHVANLAVAWIATKLTEPVRLTVTLAAVPSLARYFGYVTPKEEAESTEPSDTSPENAEEESETQKTTGKSEK